MKVLLLSDVESPYFWDYYEPGRLDGVDLILSCGDLSSKYLTFLVTMGRAPLLYVHGNHDKTYVLHPPEGCDCVEDKLVTVKGQDSISKILDMVPDIISKFSKSDKKGKEKDVEIPEDVFDSVK